jgi:hypothetical protein
MKSNYVPFNLTSADYDRSPVPNRQVNPIWARARQRLGQAGRSLLAYFFGSTEPQISIRYDSDGQPLFVAYDPVDRVRRTFATEQALRVWLEQRYYL